MGADTMTATLDVDAGPSHRYMPRGAAKAVLSARGSEVLLSGPAGTGKSRACLEKLLFMALLTPGFQGLIVRKTAASLASSALKTWRKIVAIEAFQAGVVHFYGGSGEEPPQYRFSNGSSIAIGGMDKPSKIMSTEYDVIYVQEATELTIDDWEALTTRLRSGLISFQQLIADCNPDRPTHWLKKRCDEGTTELLESQHTDNPALFDDAGGLTQRGRAYLDVLDKLTGVRKLRLRDGKWVAAEGGVYEDVYDEHTNVMPGHIMRKLIKPEWKRIWSVDFGFTNPFVLGCWAEDPDGRLYLYREIYRTKRLVEDHAKDILRAVTMPRHGAQGTDEDPLTAINEGRRVWTEPQPAVIVCDHDAEDRATLERHLGMPTVAAHKAVKEGIQAVASRMRPAEDGKPRIYIGREIVIERDQALDQAKKPGSTVEEIPGYVWDTGSGKETKETPRKEDDHGCDMTRYTVAQCDLGAQLNVRWLE